MLTAGCQEATDEVLWGWSTGIALLCRRPNTHRLNTEYMQKAKNKMPTHAFMHFTLYSCVLMRICAYVRMEQVACAFVHLCVCVCVSVRQCVRQCASVCVSVCQCVWEFSGITCCLHSSNAPVGPWKLDATLKKLENLLWKTCTRLSYLYLETLTKTTSEM